ncbi:MULTISPECIES: glycerol-3-phosphate dehydrogenase [Acetobacter]|uniref:Glycerol-3-phosphate dehydrogenase n=2 Tax=Acetobacter TaxID=434 RepID=A0AAN1U903_9PROT|nr:MULTISPECIES: glycerol-3-phosphate dehydrogenase [Acetobacter]ASL40170.1 glycerol-3-phosphate dehydrogenase [Acetobacter oryzifermentans]AXN00396.1 glycerol-3-phosphate dehydrogenase [Acetobacter pomorum]KAA8399299.1 glycerol-3-phosphate dehydrogenase [Acetobacter sp. DmW_125127]KAA8400025.1 glycerol-3-phosphate dehydrogenase [Acetobacter sp. DmW_125128]KAA8400804.1 glycerol-3-phosphate dehydrogenase [Acetobacter sp. DmW_125124]
MTTPTASPARIYDLLIVGGGVNGAGIARDAVGRGASVLLVEQDDLASYTSSSSTKLIHGGLRYLEYYEFRLVREALMERERLLKMAPHIMWPLRFVLPHSKLVRPAWMLKAGLFLYDHLASNMTLPKSRGIDFRTHSSGAALKPEYTKGFVYSDGWVQDSRLVVLNAMDAAERGADVRTRTRLIAANRANGVWEATLEDRATGKTTTVRAKALVNAAGPWVARLLADTLKIPNSKSVRLVKGSHIIVPRVYEGPQAYIFQNPDKRIVFAIPYEQKFTLIGTTDIPWKQEPGKVNIAPDEVTYLCESVNRYLNVQVKESDVVWSYAGLRPLYDDASANASAVTRDYVLDLDTQDGAPLLSIFGGKITTYRKLAEHALEKLAPVLPAVGGESWTAQEVLPGGDLGDGGFDQALARLRRTAPWLPEGLAWRLMRNYGSRTYEIIGEANSMQDMGEVLGGDLTSREVDYLISREWARTAEDVLWRRSKLGLHLSDAEKANVEAYVGKKLA